MGDIKLGVLSDTHGDFQTAYRAVEEMGNVDRLLHGGDYQSDAEDLSFCVPYPVISVLGNGDYGQVGKFDQLIEIGDCRIWLTHGHLYGVKSGLKRILTQAKDYRVDLVVYGHTHLADCQKLDGIILFNPGSIRYPLGSNKPSYGVIKINSQKKIETNIFYLNSKG
jgi:putative phosphoesterase